MKLNLGCGTDYRKGFINVDLYAGGADVCNNAVTLVSFEAQIGKIAEIHAYHVIEHLPRPGACVPNARDAVRRWYELLETGGLLVVECPNFEAIVERYAKTREAWLKSWIFGLHESEGDTHSWGYGMGELVALLREAGFRVIKSGFGTDARAAKCSCLRVEGVKE